MTAHGFTRPPLLSIRWFMDMGSHRSGRGSVLHRIFRSSSVMASLFAYFMLLIGVFAVVAMQLLSGHFDFPDGYPRGNFDSFLPAALTMFQVTTADTWMSVLWDAMRVNPVGG
jgi:Ion transport protein